MSSASRVLGESYLNNPLSHVMLGSRAEILKSNHPVAEVNDGLIGRSLAALNRIPF